MEDNLRSAGVLKKKSSSGCLIIKKKAERGHNSGGLIGGLSICSGSSSKEKKRPRLVRSESSSSDDDEPLELVRRRVNDKKMHNSSGGHRKSVVEGKEHDRREYGSEEISGERKRSRLDLYEFDEYDEFDGKMMRNEYMEERFKMASQGGGGFKGFGGGSSIHNAVLHKRMHGMNLDGSGNGKSKGVEYDGGRSKGLEFDEDEADMPISLLRLKYQEMPNEPIRLQGKNGVLKVMVNKKKKMDLPSRHKKFDPRVVQERKCSMSENAVKKEVAAQPSFCSASGSTAKPGLFPDKEKKSGREIRELKSGDVFADKQKSVKKKKREPELDREKSTSSKRSKARNLEIDDTDTSLKLASSSPRAVSSKKGTKKEGERSPDPPKDYTPSKGKEGKAKRGGSTEKQVLREKIRGMLIDAGWTIDYRPRRNRDYLDAVYINPSGTAYWSIIKAYDALKKQLEEDNCKSKSDGGSSLFSPLSEDLIHKLTRQTKKKIEEQKKRKRKEDGVSKRSAGREEATDSSDSDQNEDRPSSYLKKGKSQKDKFHEIDEESGDDVSDDSAERKSKENSVDKRSHPKVIHGRTTNIIGRCTLLVRNFDQGQNSESDGYVPYTGKRTVLAWLIDSGKVELSQKVQYMNRRRTRVMLEGWITRDGIHCGCCSKILTVSKFELHAGSKLRQPYHNIFLESGVSLLQCQVDAWNSQEESSRQDFHTVAIDVDDPDDDTCGICADGGDLMCCDSCPSTFHQSCLDIQILPSGDWHCPNCTCKFCGNVAEQDDSIAKELVRCSLCEKIYHKSCSDCAPSVSSDSTSQSFCGLKCQEVYDHLQKIAGIKHELEAGFSWSLIQRTNVDSDTSHRSFPQRVECNSKLAVALSVMDECFLPIIDRKTGINIIHNAIYNTGSNFNRLNYRGFYTAILERGDEIISAASIRIHGTRLAEMPFIGTRESYRRQGMCRRLLSAIELALCSLKVEKLIIPAISEHISTWTTIFGFHQLEDIDKKEMKSMNMLVFPGTDMLQKQLVKQELSDVGKKVVASKENQYESPVAMGKSDVDSSMDHKKGSSAGAGGFNEIKNDIVDDVADSGSSESASPSNQNIASSLSDSARETNIPLASEEATMIKSDIENELKESTTSSSSPFASVAGTSEVGDGIMGPPKKFNTLSSFEVVSGNACKVNSNGPCPLLISDSLVENLNVAEESSDHQNLASVSDIYTDEMQPDPVPASHDANGIRSKLDVTCGVGITELQGDASTAVKACNDAVQEINVKDGFVQSLSETSPKGKIEEVSVEQSLAAFPAAGASKPSLSLVSPDLNQPLALDTESELQPSLETSHDSLDVIGAQVPRIKDNIDQDDNADGKRYGSEASFTKKIVKVNDGQPTVASSVEVSAQGPVVELNKSQSSVHRSSVHGDCESTTKCSMDLNEKAVFDLEINHAGSNIVDSGVGTPSEADNSHEANAISTSHDLHGKVARSSSSSEAFSQRGGDGNANRADSGCGYDAEHTQI